MGIVVYAMIYAASALMVYNIVRCSGFVKRMRVVSGLDKTRSILPIPLALLVLFLVGYLAVALFGTPDPIIAGILFGGSVFVFIVFEVMYQIVDRLSESNARSDALYEEIRSELRDLAKDYLVVMRVNLTKDIIEEKVGLGAEERAYSGQSYSEFTELQHIDGGSGRRSDVARFDRESLLASYESGLSEVEETFRARLADGTSAFVKTKATLAVQPGTGDVVAFITESLCNGEMVNEALLGKALLGQFDMIASIVDGRFSVVIGDGANARGGIFPTENTGDYKAYIECQVAPALCGDQQDRAAVLDALDIDRVGKELSSAEPYEVNLAVEADDDVSYKRFDFYAVEPEANFYLLLKSDTTEARREEMLRSEQLAEALESAQRANRSKTTFFSNMSHDIRTPMNAIVGYTDFAKKSDSLDQIREYLDKIDSSGKYLLSLINDVLEMSRIESGKMELATGPADLHDMMDELRSMFEGQMAEKSIAYTVDASGIADSNVLCDKTRFNRVAFNLVSNAYKFTPEGGSVTVELSQVDGPLSDGEGFASFELRVKDTGIGMSEEFLHRVFDAFERERTSQSEGIQGTGLGMAITKSIVDAMGGTIGVSSELGVGTEFVVRVPLELQKTADVEVSGRDETLSACAEELDFDGIRVLLAEDNEINREIAFMILESMGFSVASVADGKQALEMLLEEDPGAFGAIVTDIQMPVMDGYELARRVRALDDPVLAKTPIVAMSANAFQEDVQASLDAGMNGHVSKPIDVAFLAQTMRTALCQARRCNS